MVRVRYPDSTEEIEITLAQTGEYTPSESELETGRVIVGEFAKHKREKERLERKTYRNYTWLRRVESKLNLCFAFSNPEAYTRGIILSEKIERAIMSDVEEYNTKFPNQATQEFKEIASRFTSNTQE